MNFVNLAHGAFAMAGGYLAAMLSNKAGRAVPRGAAARVRVRGGAGRGARAHALPAAVPRGRISTRCCSPSASCSWRWPPIDYFFGAHAAVRQAAARSCAGASRSRGVGIGAYRLFIIVVCGLLTLVLQLILTRTRFGSRLRAAVDDPRVASGLGIDVNVVFLATFAFGSGLAGLGGALGAELLGLDPTFPLKYMIYFLVVVAVGGTTTITGPLLASLLLGIADVAGKYYVPKLGAFIIYCVMIAVLMRAAAGPVRAAGSAMTASPQPATAGSALARVRARGRALAPWEIALWSRRSLAWFVFPRHAALLERDRDPGAVRRVARPDPGLRRHRVARAMRRSSAPAAYAAALFAKHVMPDPLVGLVVATAAAALLGAGDAASLVLRGTDLTRLMVTLGVALILYELANRFDKHHRRRRRPAGRRRWARCSACSRSTSTAASRMPTAWRCSFVLFFLARRIVHSPFGYALMAIRDNRAARDGAIGIGRERHARDRLHARGGLRRRRRRAARADHRLRLARRARLPSLGRRAARAGDRRHRLSLRRRDRRRRRSSVMHDVLSR